MQHVNNIAKYTFIPNKTTIDHVLIEKSSANLNTSFKILNKRDVVTSDHLPILFAIAFTPFIPTESQSRMCIAWNQCTQQNISVYQSHIENNIEKTFIPGSDSCNYSPYFINDSLIDIILQTSKSLSTSHFNRHAKPHWSSEVKQSYAQMLHLRNIWFESGRPRDQSQVLLSYKQAKTAFRRTERHARELY